MDLASVINGVIIIRYRYNLCCGSNCPWFNFIFLCSRLIIINHHTQKRKWKMKLSNNIYKVIFLGMFESF